MVKEIAHILHGNIFWMSLKLKYRINYQNVVLVLVNENSRLDYFCLAYLEEFVKRKGAKKSIIFCSSEETESLARDMGFPFPVQIEYLSENKTKLLYDAYSFKRIFDNIVFSYTDEPADNLLGRILRETEVNEEDAACLALYHLRSVPGMKEKYRRESYV